MQTALCHFEHVIRKRHLGGSAQVAPMLESRGYKRSLNIPTTPATSGCAAAAPTAYRRYTIGCQPIQTSSVSRFLKGDNCTLRERLHFPQTKLAMAWRGGGATRQSTRRQKQLPRIQRGQWRHVKHMRQQFC